MRVACVSYIEDNNYFYYLTDHLGNNRAVATATAGIVQRTQYYPFGLPFGDAQGRDLQPYTYNGKENDSRLQLNLMDYVARQNNNTYGRFTSMDPLAEKYFSWSPYAYCANNPLKFIDPDGMDIRIFFTMGKQNFSFLFNGSNYDAAPKNNAFVQSALQAYKYNIGNKGGESMQALAESTSMTVQLVESRYGDNVHKSGTVFWTPNVASLPAEAHVYSPATTLEHEMAHALSYLTDPKLHEERSNMPDTQYDNAEERRVITGPEATTAQANREFPQGYVRTDHKDYGEIKVSDPTKITPISAPVQQDLPSIWERIQDWWNNK